MRRSAAAAAASLWAAALEPEHPAVCECVTGGRRRAIRRRLAGGPATVGDATAGFGVSKPAISKHPKVLEETGVLTRVIQRRTHLLSLDTLALGEAADGMDRQRAVWRRLFDVIDE